MKILLALFPIIIMLVNGQAPRPVYGPPKVSSGGGDPGDQISEPANYKFSYEVKDDKAGLDFGHMESREGDSAKGSYHVLLPDGRHQKVDYVADENGYMPNVVYDGEARPDSFGTPGRSGGTTAGSGSKVGSTGTDSGDGGGYRY